MQEGFINVAGGRVWYKKVGTGKDVPLLIAHGGPGMPHDYLEPLVGLATERSVIFWDQLGCGRSDRPTDISLWNLPRFIDELNIVIQALDLTELIILGHSWGTILAVEYALTNAQGLQGLILASPCLNLRRWMQDAIYYRSKLLIKTQQVLERNEAAGTTESAEYQEAVFEFYRRHVCRMNPWPEPVMRAIENSNEVIYEILWGQAEFLVTGELADYDCTERLPQITVPVLLTAGLYDEATPDAVFTYAKLLSNASVAIFDNSAHLPHLEETIDYLNVVQEFLNKLKAT
ncbi:MAG: proline iminopeptidase-family hydrolase [Acidobacteriota bacterium]